MLKAQAKFVSVLEGTLIPDLKEVDHPLVDDFERAVSFMRQAERNYVEVEERLVRLENASKKSAAILHRMIGGLEGSVELIEDNLFPFPDGLQPRPTRSHDAERLEALEREISGEIRSNLPDGSYKVWTWQEA